MSDAFRFANPWLLTAFSLLPLLWWLWSRPGRRPVLRFSDISHLRTAAGSSSAARWRSLLPILRTIALASLTIAAARPQVADSTFTTYSEGVAILLVLDTSGSMEDRDLSPRGKPLTRLDVVKEIVRKFVSGDESLSLPGRTNDLIGLIRFARYADSVCPLTLDRDALLAALDQTNLVTTREENGTAIGDGLALAVERLRDLKRTMGSGEQIRITSRVVILLTDGENNAGQVDPQQAGELAAVHGVKVYTILAGTGENLTIGRRPVDDRVLRRIAEVSGGRFYSARDQKSLVDVYSEIDKLERTRVEERAFVRWDEWGGPWLLLAAFAALALQILLDATWLRKIP